MKRDDPPNVLRTGAPDCEDVRPGCLRAANSGVQMPLIRYKRASDVMACTFTDMSYAESIGTLPGDALGVSDKDKAPGTGLLDGSNVVACERSCVLPSNCGDVREIVVCVGDAASLDSDALDSVCGACCGMGDVLVE